MGKKGEQRLRWQGSNAAQAEYENAVAEANRKRQERMRLEGRAKPNRPPKRPRIEYDKYIKSNQWAGKRKEVIRNRGGKCEVCGGAENLQVHHKTYARLGREKMKDLRLLCGGCHRNEHEKDGVADPVTDEYIKFMQQEGL